VATNWEQASATFRQDLTGAVPTEVLRALHRVRPWRHALVALRQFALLALSVWLILRFRDRPEIWIPAVVLEGFVIFSFTVLLHEVVHRAVFAERRSPLNRLLALLYGLPSGLAPTQFERWHLDHHDHLGTSDQDPKRAYLSPKRNARWFKLLYFTPALFPIYFRAAARAARGYAPALRRRIAVERFVVFALHIGIFVGVGLAADWWLAVQVHALAVFVVFPVAFALNRLGQHYDVDPRDPAHWGTLMRRSPLLWDPVFLWSNYHLEHHYFPRVPFYHLPALRRALEGFFAARDIRARSYGGLLVDWLVRNRPPHTDWQQPA
jgi:fatty acid desaturase